MIALVSIASIGIVKHRSFNPLAKISNTLSKIGVNETEVRLEVLEAGFQNIDEFRRKYVRAKEICEASNEDLKNPNKMWVGGSRSCISEIELEEKLQKNLL